MSDQFKLGVIGCGVIGERRALNVPSDAKTVACYDTDLSRATKLAEKAQAKTSSTLDEFLAQPLDGVVIATINSALKHVAEACLAKGLPVLIEKPAARSYRELEGLKNPHKKLVKIGFNHRFHPAFIELKKRIKDHPEDPVMFVDCHYGNGARLGFDKEWRSNPELSGGGELLDQGVHVLDLGSEILGTMSVKTAWIKTHYWNMPVDDNAWIVCGTPKGQSFSMQVSSTEWKNEFRFDVYTRTRRLQWIGLGRSYGTERLTIYQMPAEMGPPSKEEIEYKGEDQSWLLENTNFIRACRGQAEADGEFRDALRALKLVENAYEFSSRLEHETPHPKWWQG